MLRLNRIIKSWKESAALNAHINLYGFWNDTTFLTKSGDVGMVLRVTGVDYVSLDRSEQEYAVKRAMTLSHVINSSLCVAFYPRLQPFLSNSVVENRRLHALSCKAGIFSEIAL